MNMLALNHFINSFEELIDDSALTAVIYVCVAAVAAFVVFCVILIGFCIAFVPSPEFV